MSGIQHVGIERLNVDNYATWSTRMRLFLVSQGLWTAVKGQLSADSEADSKADDKALALIGLSVKDHHLTTIASCETAKQAWDALEAVYQAKSIARRLQLKRALNSLRRSRTRSSRSTWRAQRISGTNSQLPAGAPTTKR